MMRCKTGQAGQQQDDWHHFLQGVVDLLSPQHAYEKILEQLKKTTRSNTAGMAMPRRHAGGEWEFFPTGHMDKLPQISTFFRNHTSDNRDSIQADATTRFYPLYDKKENLIGVVFLEKGEKKSELSDIDAEQKVEQMISLLQPVVEREEKMMLNRREGDIKHLGVFVGDSPAMGKVYCKIKKVAKTDASVVVTGESGTGKELVAQAIHQLSDRRHKQLVDVNCAAIPEDLMESEFFGHEKGAFSGAVGTKQGKFELASGGTLFLDEIGELPMSLQGKFLRVLQEKTVWRVGGQKAIPVDVRIVTATHRNLKEQVDNNKFRADLYYRLHTYPIDLPPLRDRGDDIVLLSHYFLYQVAHDIAGFTPEALEALKNYTWPGNVRELYHEIERAVLNHEGKDLLSAHSLFSHLAKYEKPLHASMKVEEKTLDHHIMMTLQKTLIRNHYNKSRTAKELGIYPKRLDRLMKKYSL